MKEAIIGAVESFLDGRCRDKTKVMSSVKDIKLSYQTVARRVEQTSNDLESQMPRNLQSSEFFVSSVKFHDKRNH